MKQKHTHRWQFVKEIEMDICKEYPHLGFMFVCECGKEKRVKQK